MSRLPGYNLSPEFLALERHHAAQKAGPGYNGGPPLHGGVKAYSTFDLAGDLPDFMRGGYSNSTGRSVTEAGALRNATFFRAVNLIASAIGMLPLQLFERKANGDLEKARSHNVFRLLHKRPNDFQTPLEFKSYMQGRAVLHGDAYAYKILGSRGVQGLAPLDPKRVKPVLRDDFTLVYDYTPKSGGVRRYSREEIFHLRAPWSSDGITGDGLLKVAAETLGLALSADEAAGRLMQNGSYVGGVLQHPKSLSPEASERLRIQFAERFTGSQNAGRWIVTEEDMKVAPFGMTGREAQGIEQRKYQAEEASRFTGVPRPLLMFDETSWGSGIEQLGLFFVTYCLLPWFVAWEQALARDLLSDAEQDRYFAKFIEAALLRGSLKDQAEFFSKALGGPGTTGFMVPNEAREKMDMNSIPGGDQPGWGAAQNGGADGA